MEKSEAKIQQEIWMYLNNTFCLKSNIPRWIVFAVPNGGKRDAREAKSLKNTGILSGVSDLILQTDKETIYIEVKNTTGRQSEEQKEFQKRVEDLGFKYWLVKSVQEVTTLLQK
jgi:hypothetical protein